MLKKFSHCDLFASSIFVDLKAPKVTIVDWEYAAMAYWSNDLGKLGTVLEADHKQLLVDVYYREMHGTGAMPAHLSMEITLNSFVHKFLTMTWGIKLGVISPQTKERLEALREEANYFLPTLKAMKNLPDLNAVVSHYSLMVKRLEHGVFVGQLPRPIREINEILYKIQAGQYTHVEGIEVIMEIARRLGNKHPIYLVACACSCSDKIPAPKPSA